MIKRSISGKYEVEISKQGRIKLKGRGWVTEKQIIEEIEFLNEVVATVRTCCSSHPIV